VAPQALLRLDPMQRECRSSVGRKTRGIRRVKHFCRAGDLESFRTGHDLRMVITEEGMAQSGKRDIKLRVRRFVRTSLRNQLPRTSFQGISRLWRAVVLQW
jgi:hypothetical protein